MSYGVPGARKIDKSAKMLETFLRRLLSKDAVTSLKAGRATFWRKATWAWRIWPVVSFTGEVHDIALLNGIWLRRRATVLAAVASGHVVSRHLAQAERAAAWAALMLHTPASEMPISDGSPGLIKAASLPNRA